MLELIRVLFCFFRWHLSINNLKGHHNWALMTNDQYRDIYSNIVHK